MRYNIKFQVITLENILFNTEWEIDTSSNENMELVQTYFDKNNNFLFKKFYNDVVRENFFMPSFNKATFVIEVFREYVFNDGAYFKLNKLSDKSIEFLHFQQAELTTNLCLT